VDLRLRNVETLKTDGLDFSVRYARETGIGTLSVNAEGTYVLRYQEAESPGAALLELRSSPHNPTDLRLRTLFGWEYRGFSAWPAMNYQSGYRDSTLGPPTRSVTAWTTWDLVLTYKLKPFDQRLGGETEIAIRGRNIFNQQPPFLNNWVSGIGFDPENGDLLGRRVGVNLQHRW
jgi:outer membrane receptor protein involved in Fe transport